MATATVESITQDTAQEQYITRCIDRWLQHHEGIISKEQFKAIQLEMELRSNVEIGEDGKARRKSKKYSSKRRKQLSNKFPKKEKVNANKEK